MVMDGFDLLNHALHSLELVLNSETSFLLGVVIHISSSFADFFSNYSLMLLLMEFQKICEIYDISSFHKLS